MLYFTISYFVTDDDDDVDGGNGGVVGGHGVAQQQQELLPPPQQQQLLPPQQLPPPQQPLQLQPPQQLLQGVQLYAQIPATFVQFSRHVEDAGYVSGSSNVEEHVMTWGTTHVSFSFTKNLKKTKIILSIFQI